MPPKSTPNYIINRIIRQKTKDRNTIKAISRNVRVSRSTISKILNRKLEDTRSKYSTKRTYISFEDVEKMVKLRTKDRCMIKEIAQKIRLPKHLVSTILKDKLKDTISEYSTLRTYISKEDVKEIVQLRKECISLKNIQEKLGIDITLISSILRCELGDKYQEYSAKNIPSQVRNRIIFLHKLKPLNEISKITKVSFCTVKSIVQESFDIIYDKIISEIPTVMIQSFIKFR
ncbi:hypothetical protein LCGC14_1419440 [marine sediment metagenome]|uniref:Uncharacterized protein n=1 Tax=marine sediment metagenome TaxID=412755 RepID=A0A0F9M7C3_9ZZZZ